MYRKMSTCFQSKKRGFIIYASVLVFLMVSGVLGSRSYEDGTGSFEGTVLDKITGLRWTKCSMKSGGVMDDTADCSGPAAEYTWEQAVDVCNNLNYKGIITWRLPNIRELQSIVTYYRDKDPLIFINTDYFPNIPKGKELGLDQSHFWSSTTYANDARRAWSFDFLWGSSPGRWKTATAFVRCVSGP